MLNKIRNVYTERPDEHFLKEKDNWAPLVFEHVFSMPLLRLMQRLHLKIHPNVITLASFLIVLATAYFFFCDKLLIGAFCYLGYFIFDGLDGKWARLTNSTSELGEKLDYYFGALGVLAMYLGLWYSQYYLAGNWLTGTGIIAAHYIIVVAIGIFIQQPHYETIFPRVCSYYSPLEEGFGTFFVAPLFNVVTILFPLLVLFQFISFVILLVRQKERPDTKKRVRALLKIGV
jgi:phosphatidylglycerophosphate synthase